MALRSCVGDRLNIFCDVQKPPFNVCSGSTAFLGRLNFLPYQDRNGPKADLISAVLDAHRPPDVAFPRRQHLAHRAAILALLQPNGNTFVPSCGIFLVIYLAPVTIGNDKQRLP